MAENFEEIKTPEELPKNTFEGRDGKQFHIENVDAQSPDLKIVHNKLEGAFDKSENDSFETLQKAVAEEGYHVDVAKDSKGEIQGLFNSGVVEMMNNKGEPLKDAVLFIGHVFTEPAGRGQGILKNLEEIAHNTALEDAKEQDLKLKASVAETHSQVEKTFNELGYMRPYIKTKEGYAEVPYEQPPIEYDKETGKPIEGARAVSENLMLRLESGKKTFSSKELGRMVNGIYDYNYYQDESYFKNSQAYDAHNEIIDGIKGRFTDFIGKNEIHLFSVAERDAFTKQGIKFIEHQTGENLKDKSEDKKSVDDTLGLDNEKSLRSTMEALENAKIPKGSLKPEEILKDAGIEKPANSFDEVQKRLTERLNNSGGEKLSESDRLEKTRDFYLGELGYDVKYKGLFNGKAELLYKNEKGETATLTDGKGKNLEFKTFFNLKEGRTPLTDFLKEKLKEKFDGPIKRTTEEEKIEQGYQKIVKETENAQATRSEKFGFLQGIKKFSNEKLNNFFDGAARLGSFFGERGMVGLEPVRRLALEGGRNLLVIGLSPLGAIEEIQKEMQLNSLINESESKEKRIREFEQKPRFEEYTEFLKKESETINERWIKAYGSIRQKSKILGLIERL